MRTIEPSRVESDLCDTGGVESSLMALVQVGAADGTLTVLKISDSLVVSLPGEKMVRQMRGTLSIMLYLAIDKFAKACVSHLQLYLIRHSTQVQRHRLGSFSAEWLPKVGLMFLVQINLYRATAVEMYKQLTEKQMPLKHDYAA
jgi:hypothetical protein